MLVLSEERIREGETSVKIHMFMTMILAQAEAIEEDKAEVELTIARAARDSLVFCESLLGARAQGSSGTAGVGGPLELREGSPEGESGISGIGIDGGQGFDLEGFGEEFAWESFFPDGRFCY